MHALWRRAVRDHARISGIHVRQAAAGQAGRWIVGRVGPVPPDLIAGRVLARHQPARCRD